MGRVVWVSRFFLLHAAHEFAKVTGAVDFSLELLTLLPQIPTKESQSNADTM